MSGLLCVLPVISAHTTDICVESLLMKDSAAGLDPDDILVIDNTREGWAHRYGLRVYRDGDGHNLGVARSWNIGAREVLERDLDYLVLMSTAMRFGPELHTTWTRQMQEFWGAKVIEADGHSHHLIAFHRTVFEKIGLWDENFYPAYHEATDFGYRMRLVGWEHGFQRVWVNALSQGHAMHVDMVACPAAPLLEYYRRKWNGDKLEERWVQPFGSKPIDYWEPVPIPVLAERYGLGEYGKDWW